ncbi:PAS domain-containing protein [Halorussus amylolyticus]|uniref:PAS domain-containing protein n=1 Tax=Halorussus amylolyticus TaxID=1126242 RepID=UPI00104A3935|nr:PAS domain-containing protein [Halorussus amylolyticus]
MERRSASTDPSLSIRDDIRVLHVDDEPGFAEMVGEFVERESDTLSVTAVADASEALDRLETERFDCVVSDYEMPETTGLELFAELQGRGVEVPFVLFTGQGSEEIASKAISAGVTDYLQKQTGTDQYALLAKRVRDAVEKHRTEYELERHDDLLARTQEIASVGGWEVELATMRLRWTREVYRIYGVEPSFETTVESAMEQYHPDDRPAIREAVERAVGEGESFDLELRIVTPDDETRWVRVRGEATGRAPDGETDRLRGTIQDISETVANEAELRLKNRALDEAEIGVTIADPTQDDDPIVYANRGFERVTGYPADEVLGRNCRLLQGPETEDAPVAAMREAIRDERPVTVDVLNYRKDGTPFWNHVSISPVFDGESVSHFLGFQRDVTDRKRLEQELRSSEVALRELYRVASDSESTFEERLRRTLVVGCERLGLSVGYLTRIDDETQVVVESHGGHEHLRRGESTPLSRTYCRKTIDADGLLAVEHAGAGEWDDDPAYDLLGLECYLGGTVTVDGERYGTLCFADTEPRDEPFTDSERAFVELLTNWVSHEFEQQSAQRRLERKNQRLDEFTSVVSHDLRNPLNVAQGNLDLAMESVEHDRLETVETALDRIEGLIDTLLSLARQGEDVSETTDVSVADVAEDAWTTIETDGATLDVAATGSVEADRDRLQQLLENLFTNAVEHGSTSNRTMCEDAVEHGSDVTVTVSDLESGFAVSDDGRGIPDEEKSEVFAAGYSSDADGTGLGLSIVERICDAHGWTILVTDSPTGGAQFEITGVERP